MLPRLSNVPLSNVPTSNTTTKLSVSGLVNKGMNVSETQGSQQCVSDDTVADCSRAKNRRVSDFGVNVTSVSGTGIVKAEKKEYPCNQCGKIFQSATKFDLHVKVVHEMSYSETCGDCGQVFKNREYLDKPKGSKHVSQEKKYKCDQCDQTFVSPSKLKRHKIVHTTGCNYECSDCHMTYRHPDSLAKHRLKEHGPPREPFICKECGSSFFYNSGLKRHKLIHSGKKPYKCEICGKRFSDRTAMNKHTGTHNKKSLKCALCGKNFKLETRLNKHKCAGVDNKYGADARIVMRILHQQKPWNCIQDGTMPSCR